MFSSKEAAFTTLVCIRFWSGRINLLQHFAHGGLQVLESSPAAHDFQHYNFQAINCKYCAFECGPRGCRLNYHSEVLMLGDRPRNCQINDNVGIVWGALSTKASKREIIVTQNATSRRYLFMYEHPVSSEHHSAQHRLVSSDSNAGFLLFWLFCMCFFALKKKSRKKSQKKAF